MKGEVIGSNPINGSKMSKKWQIVLATAMVLWFGFFIAQKIDLVTADLGRHLKNGEIILHAPWNEKVSLLTTNFYSYTMPGAPFINHHWGSGVIFYLVWKYSGFGGLSLFYVFLSIFAVFLMWLSAKKISDFWAASLSSIFLLPLIVSRTEIRPEVFTYLMSGLFFYSLSTKKFVWALPLLMAAWVNLHIGFVFGFLILGAFGLQELLKLFKRETNDFKKLFLISATSVIAALINPFGWKAVVYPFEIFGNYDYRIVENQSIIFLIRWGMVSGMHFALFGIVAISLTCVFAYFIRQKIEFPVSLLILVFVSGTMAFLGIRHFSSFALFSLPASAFLFYRIYSILSENNKEVFKYSVSLLFLFAIFFQTRDLIALRPVMGFGLLPGEEDSADFFKTNGIVGPIFNNYDIGGYLIYNLYPQQKIFVDNRPEAYSQSFFENLYIKPQEDEVAWRTLESQYGFNAIFFSRRDYTPWGQEFLAARMNDPEWVPVFADIYNIVFIKKNTQNASLIKKYEITKPEFVAKPG